MERHAIDMAKSPTAIRRVLDFEILLPLPNIERLRCKHDIRLTVKQEQPNYFTHIRVKCCFTNLASELDCASACCGKQPAQITVFD